MKVRVYFSKEPDTVEIILKAHKISRQALDTIYELVWECEFKNILNVGRIWLKFKEENRPFGISLRDKRTHRKISLGDIIQIDKDYYMVNSVGARKVKLVD
jgi:DNA helicase TIP49 (TBP-interacting protein)